MPETRMLTTFDELIKKGILEIGDGYRARLEELGGTGPLFLRAGLLAERGIEWNDAERFHANLALRFAAKIGQSGDTIVTTKGNSVGRTGYVPPDAPSFVYSPHLSYWRSLDTSELSPDYLRYWSRSPEFTAQLKAMASSTDMAPYLSLIDQRRLKISLPPANVQKGIGSTLGALDDKIAVNGRITRTSFDLAETIYMRLSAQSTSLSTLGDLIDLEYGKSLPASTRQAGDIPVYGSGGKIGTHDQALVTGPGAIIGRKGTVGAVYWSEEDFFPIDTTFYARPRSASIPMEFVFFTLRSLGLDTMNSDSAVPGLNRSNALALKVRIPDEQEIRKFRERVRQIFALRHALDVESASLAKLRDTLLPKLMSGEIRVRDAKKVVEEAT